MKTKLKKKYLKMSIMELHEVLDFLQDERANSVKQLKEFNFVKRLLNKKSK